MRSLKYTNGVLSVLAVLLALNLYVTWVDTPAGAMLTPGVEARAQSGMPNAAQQRREMIDEVKLTNKTLDELKTLLTSGEVRVKTEAPQRD